jgi:osmotically-inducible protein OsmY
MKKLGLGAALGMLLALLLDPRNGKRRRRQLRDRTAGLLRRGVRRGERLGRGVAAEAYGVKQKATHLREQPKEQPNDATLAAKVRSEVFRGADMPKGAVDVNAENGIVILRGQVDRPELIDDLERKVRRVQGVHGVENLLHLPGTEAPMHAAHRS